MKSWIKTICLLYFFFTSSWAYSQTVAGFRSLKFGMSPIEAKIILERECKGKVELEEIPILSDLEGDDCYALLGKIRSVSVDFTNQSLDSIVFTLALTTSPDYERSVIEFLDKQYGAKIIASNSENKYWIYQQGQVVLRSFLSSLLLEFKGPNKARKFYNRLQ